MRPTVLPILCLCLSLVACDEQEPSSDAGPDATDAGRSDGGLADAGSGDAGSGDAGAVDAGPPDAGPPDAGSPDAGPADAGPPTREELATAVQAESVALDSAIDGVPMEMRVDGAYADLELSAGGVDALIGEDALMTLSLSDATVRALADLHTADLLLESLDRVIADLEGRAEASSVRAQTVALRDALATYRAFLAQLYRDRLELGIAGAPVVEDPLYLNLQVVANGMRSRLLAVVEGASATAETARVIAECFPSQGTIDVTLEAIEVETRTSLGTASGSNTANLTLNVPFEQTTAVALLWQGAPSLPSGDFAEVCNLSVESRRRLRAAPVAVPVGDATFDGFRSDYFDALTQLETEIGMLRAGGSDATVLDAAERAMLRVRDLVAGVFASEGLPMPVEYWQRLDRQDVYVRAMVDALVASHPLSDPGFSFVRTGLTDLIVAAQGMLAFMAAL